MGHSCICITTYFPKMTHTHCNMNLPLSQKLLLLLLCTSWSTENLRNRFIIVQISILSPAVATQPSLESSQTPRDPVLRGILLLNMEIPSHCNVPSGNCMYDQPYATIAYMSGKQKLSMTGVVVFVCSPARCGLLPPPFEM